MPVYNSRPNQGSGCGDVKAPGQKTSARSPSSGLRWQRKDQLHGPMLTEAGEKTWVINSGQPLTIRLHFVSDTTTGPFLPGYSPLRGVFVGSINNCDLSNALPSIALRTIDLKIKRLIFLQRLLSRSPTPIRRPRLAIRLTFHSMYPFDVVTSGTSGRSTLMQNGRYPVKPDQQS